MKRVEEGESIVVARSFGDGGITYYPPADQRTQYSSVNPWALRPYPGDDRQLSRRLGGERHRMVPPLDVFSDAVRAWLQKINSKLVWLLIVIIGVPCPVARVVANRFFPLVFKNFSMLYLEKLVGTPVFPFFKLRHDTWDSSLPHPGGEPCMSYIVSARKPGCVPGNVGTSTKKNRWNKHHHDRLCRLWLIHVCPPAYCTAV